MKKKKSIKKRWQKTPFKYKILLGVLLISVCSAGLAGAYASLKDNDAITNSLKISDLTGTIEENFEPPTTTNPAKPGSVHKKEVTVKNQSDTHFFVRILVTPEIQSKDGTLLASRIGQELLVDIQPEWVLGEDGYYYYLGKVAENKATTPLFKTVTIASNLDEKYKDATLNIQIKSETVGSAQYLYQSAWWNDQVVTETNLMKVDNTLKRLAD